MQPIELRNLNIGMTGLLSDRSADSFRNRLAAHYNTEDQQNIDNFQSATQIKDFNAEEARIEDLNTIECLRSEVIDLEEQLYKKNETEQALANALKEKEEEIQIISNKLLAAVFESNIKEDELKIKLTQQ